MRKARELTIVAAFGVALGAAAPLVGDVAVWDYILDDPANTASRDWDTSFKRIGGGYTVCGMEVRVSMPTRLTRLTVIAGGAGPGLSGPADFSTYPYFAVNITRLVDAWAASPLAGTVGNFSYNQPSSVTPWGLDHLGQPTWKLVFEFPFATEIRRNETYIVSCHTALDVGTQGAFGMLQSNVAGPLGFQARSDVPAPGYVSAADTWAWRLDAQSPCPGDLNGDRSVNSSDLGILLGAWLRVDDGDIDGDNVTNEVDLGILLANWSVSCGP